MLSLVLKPCRAPQTGISFANTSRSQLFWGLGIQKGRLVLGDRQGAMTRSGPHCLVV